MPIIVPDNWHIQVPESATGGAPPAPPPVPVNPEVPPPEILNPSPAPVQAPPPPANLMDTFRQIQPLLNVVQNTPNILPTLAANMPPPQPQPFFAAAPFANPNATGGITSRMGEAVGSALGRVPSVAEKVSRPFDLFGELVGDVAPAALRTQGSPFGVARSIASEVMPGPVGDFIQPGTGLETLGAVEKLLPDAVSKHLPDFTDIPSAKESVPLAVQDVLHPSQAIEDFRSRPLTEQVGLSLVDPFIAEGVFPAAARGAKATARSIDKITDAERALLKTIGLEASPELGQVTIPFGPLRNLPADEPVGAPYVEYFTSLIAPVDDVSNPSYEAVQGLKGKLIQTLKDNLALRAGGEESIAELAKTTAKGSKAREFDRLRSEGRSIEEAWSMAFTGRELPEVGPKYSEIEIATLDSWAQNQFTGVFGEFSHMKDVLPKLRGGAALQPHELKFLSSLLDPNIAPPGLSQQQLMRIPAALASQAKPLEFRPSEILPTDVLERYFPGARPRSSRSLIREQVHYEEQLTTAVREAVERIEGAAREKTPFSPLTMAKLDTVLESSGRDEWKIAKIDAQIARVDEAFNRLEVLPPEMRTRGRLGQLELRPQIEKASARLAQLRAKLEAAKAKELRGQRVREMADTIVWQNRAWRQANKEAERAQRRLNTEALKTTLRNDAEIEKARWAAIKSMNDVDQGVIDTLNNVLRTSPEMQRIGFNRLRTLSKLGKLAEDIKPELLFGPDTTALRQIVEAATRDRVGPEVASELTRAAEQWVNGNRAVLDAIGDSLPNVAAAAGRALRAAATGQVTDSYTTRLLINRGILATVLERVGGMEAGAARRVADYAVQRELLIRYPNGVPSTVRSALDEARIPFERLNAKTVRQDPAYSAARSAGYVVQTLKNSQFGIGDFAILGVQELKATEASWPAQMAGAVNRLLNRLHLGIDVTPSGLAKRIQFELDGVPQSASTGMTDLSDEGTVLSWLGPLGKKVDRPASQAIQGINDVQFNLILGSSRNLNYEGNLVILHLTGQDIADPAVRAIAADFANSAHSTARLALRATRRETEKALLISPSMKRAQVNQILQVAKALRPSAKPAERILAATTLSAYAGSMLLIGKFLHDIAGKAGTEFQWDPSKPGFGLLTLKNGVTINLMPQQQIIKAIARSARILTEEDPDGSKVAEQWARLGMSSASPLVGAALKEYGYGYDPRAGWRMGDWGVGMPPGQRFLSSAPIPPIMQQYLAGTLSGAEAPWEFAGVSAFKEGAYAQLDRAAKDQLGVPLKDAWELADGGVEGKDYGLSMEERLAFPQKYADWQKQSDISDLFDLMREEGIESHSPTAIDMDEYEKLRDEEFASQQARDSLFQSGQLDYEDWDRLRDLGKAFVRGAGRGIFGPSEDFDAETATRMDKFFKQVEQQTSATGVDWSAVFDWVDQQDEELQNVVHTHVVQETPLEKTMRETRDVLDEHGWYDLSETAFNRVQERYPETRVFLDYQSWREAGIQSEMNKLKKQDRYQHYAAEPLRAIASNSFFEQTGAGSMYRGIMNNELRPAWIYDPENLEAFKLAVDMGIMRYDWLTAEQQGLYQHAVDLYGKTESLPTR